MPPESSPGGQLMGPLPSSPLCFGKAAIPFFLSVSLLPEDLVTITTALTKPDGGQAGERETEKRIASTQPAHSEPTQTDSHLGIFQFACNKLQ